ncbi:hypothetical protein [Verrucosispora sp. TAA-831]|uniref:hypothetical protein n=1 Tax=Verrucosispora sp. TAA-831 TaxID=3422227 RepID=UPI003D6EE946
MTVDTLPAARNAAAPQQQTAARGRRAYRPSSGDTSLGRVLAVIAAGNAIAALAGIALHHLP